jgi:hypothetical protein
MDVGDLVLQALLSMLCGALVYFWFLKTFIVPVGTSVFNIEVNTLDEISYNIEEMPR